MEEAGCGVVCADDWVEVSQDIFYFLGARKECGGEVQSAGLICLGARSVLIGGRYDFLIKKRLWIAALHESLVKVLCGLM